MFLSTWLSPDSAREAYKTFAADSGNALCKFCLIICRLEEDIAVPEHSREDSIDSIWQLIHGRKDADLGTQSHNLGGIGEDVTNVLSEDCNQDGDNAAVDQAEADRQESCIHKGTVRVEFGIHIPYQKYILFELCCSL